MNFAKGSIDISDNARRSGLYILRKPGMGKSTLIVNLINQDLSREYNSVFFLDPHGEAIKNVLNSQEVVEIARKYNWRYGPWGGGGRRRKASRGACETSVFL